MIDERKEMAITNLLKGEQITDVAKLVGVCRQTIYDWLENEEFKAELDRRRRDIVTQGNNLILNELCTYVRELKRIALCGKSEKVRADTAQYLVDRVLGKTTTKLEVTDKDNQDAIDKDILDAELNQVDDE